ncbi:acyl-CoA N-acyltransferase [Lepidopterella palustris CBS 459.81]|uniref:Histone acetyltransferase type B catalytic subunit n=1 Tax=Lepidopterella palustris CBS 459.81 TaxID=1314670 RepID=A0A8E2EGS5_9PEZI|nr:acyl-CoA N-acyltransferase [Lepidopterella palustris CBS 459.81]
MAEELEKWIATSNGAFNINLVRPSTKPYDSQRILEEPFHPDFTYAIFGEDEAIFGYSDLELNLDFRANDLKPSLDIRYSEKWKPIGETKAMDVKEMLKGFLPDYTLDASLKPTEIPGPDATSNSWKPPGKLLQSYSLHGKKFEIWSASLSDPTAKEMFRRIQILVPFYIEGGTCQNLDDQAWTMERWTLFLLYEVTPLRNTASISPYSIVGFATSYRLWVFPTFEILSATHSIPTSATNDSTAYIPPALPTDPTTHKYSTSYNPLDAQSRERISQFIILPPYRGQSHGHHLYSVMFSTFISTPNIYEITVEDPNEAFDDMRDYADILYLRTLPSFAALALPTTLPPATLAKTAEIPVDLIFGSDATLTALRHESKISPRQFSRMLELHLLSTIPARHRVTARITRKEKSADPNDRKFYFWRLALKERLYRHNLDQLAQMEPSERIERVEAVAKAVEDEYARLLVGVEKRGRWAASVTLGNGSASDGVGGSAARGKRKKRVVDEDEDDEDDGEEEEEGEREREIVAAKRPKVSS